MLVPYKNDEERLIWQDLAGTRPTQASPGQETVGYFKKNYDLVGNKEKRMEKGA